MTDCGGLPSMRSVRACTAARPSSAVGWAMAVIGGADLPFYTAGSTAAARDGGMVVSAMRSGREMLLRGPGANGRGATSDTFSLSGFTAAYEAISKECPPGNRR